MFKFVLVAALVLGSFAALADDTSDGCGLGWQVTKKKTFSATTTRFTTNAFVPPTFGMTSGTIGCEQHALVKADMKPLHYADANYENLMTEIAQGQGEYLTGFAAAMGCSSEAFSSALQSNFSEIVEGKTPADLVRKARTIANSLNCQA
ncbi:MAG: DUF3015 family protein [Bacteriovoracaceae bacterium]